VHLADAARLRGDDGAGERGHDQSFSHGAYYNPRIKRVLIALAFVVSACGPQSAPARPAPPAHPALQASVDTILSDPALARGYWGVLVKSLKTGDTLAAVNAHKLFVPASNMKVVTLAAAAAKLGWDYTYATTIRATGSIANGILDGDLIVIGSGDPSLTVSGGMADRVFADWATRLKAAGVHVVTGRLVGDGTALGAVPYGDGWMWDDLVDEYSAGVSALQLNEDAVRVTIAPGPAVGASAAVSVAPLAGAVTIDNNITTSAADLEPTVTLRRLPGSQRLDLTGTIPLAHAPMTSGVSVADPAQFFVDSMRTALIKNGVDIKQSAVGSPQRIPNPEPRITTLFTYQSPPLSTLAVRLMKISQNQYAETLYRTIGGHEAVLQILQPWGLAPADLVQRDGSGLSRYDLVTPEAFVTILTHVWNDARAKDPFVASLPVAGDLGLTNRMKGTAAEGNARAKTGSMTGVRALSGFVTSADGEPLVFSILANNFEVESSKVNAATDAIVVALASLRSQKND
jgi:D-alanyl-D-alanine carboxypeptidase/D-alanyl-D-alanine-endopeptidase (penicillin-binding protein 4)